MSINDLIMDTSSDAVAESKDEEETSNQKKILAMPPIDFFNKSFEAMWYQAEVLHKREIEKLEAIQKSNETKIAEMEENLKIGILKFTKDILDMVQDYEIKNDIKLIKLLDLYQSLNDTLNDDPENEQEFSPPPSYSEE